MDVCKSVYSSLKIEFFSVYNKAKYDVNDDDKMKSLFPVKVHLHILFYYDGYKLLQVL